MKKAASLKVAKQETTNRQAGGAWFWGVVASGCALGLAAILTQQHKRHARRKSAPFRVPGPERGNAFKTDPAQIWNTSAERGINGQPVSHGWISRQPRSFDAKTGQMDRKGTM